MAELPEINLPVKLREIKSMGYVQTLRKGPTGIGYTLETLMGIRETNKPRQDFTYQGKRVELKSHRKGVPRWLHYLLKSL